MKISNFLFKSIVSLILIKIFLKPLKFLVLTLFIITYILVLIEMHEEILDFIYSEIHLLKKLNTAKNGEPYFVIDSNFIVYFSNCFFTIYVIVELWIDLLLEYLKKRKIFLKLNPK
jgi:hypothetical protein